MTKEQMREILDHVLTWPPEDQEKIASFVRQVEETRADGDLTDEEWKLIEARVARRDLADDDEVERLFSQYRNG